MVIEIKKNLSNPKELEISVNNTNFTFVHTKKIVKLLNYVYKLAELNSKKTKIINGK
jgi:hypothetical protein